MAKAPSVSRNVLGLSFIAFELLFCVAGGLFVWSVPHRWEAVAVVACDENELDRLEAEKQVALAREYPEASGGYFILREFERARMKYVLYPVIGRLGLTDRCKRLLPPRRRLEAILSTLKLSNRPLSTDDTFALLLKKTEIVRRKEGEFQIKVSAETPDEAAEIANAIAASYVQARVATLPARATNAAKPLVKISQSARPPRAPIFPSPVFHFGVVIPVVLFGSLGLLFLATNLRSACRAT